MNSVSDDPRNSPFINPLGNWPNDDLLISRESRDRLKEINPALLRVLDWFELREIFVRHDKAAGRGKRLSRLQGLVAVIAGGLGLILLGAVPALPKEAEHYLSIAALLLLSLGGVLGLLHWVVLRARREWLGHRFWTERLRQFYFQSLINELDLTVAAMTSDADLTTLRARRAAWLAEFHTHPGDVAERIRTVIDDQTEAEAWLRPLEWKSYRAARTPADELEPLLGALYKQRILVQIDYANKNRARTIHSPGTRAMILGVLGDGSTILLVIAAALGWLAFVLHQPVVIPAIAWTAVAAGLSAVGLIARTMNQGLQNEAEAERYEWYAEAARETKSQFEHSQSASDRVQALRRLEELCYKEMRSFLRAHSGARFLS